MIKYLKALFERRPALPSHLHVHLDEAGREILCDESTCRPKYESPLFAGPHGPLR